MPELIDKQAALDIAMSYCPDDDGNCDVMRAINKGGGGDNDSE